MTQEINLKAETRKNIEGKLEKTELQDFVPANIYGENFKNKHIKLKPQELKKAYEFAGESNLVELQVDNEEPIKVMFKEVQKNPVKENIIHVDFYKVDMTKKITTEIPLEFIGESKAIKNLNGVLIKSFNSVEVECLPGDLADHIEVDISVLNTFEDSINFKDLKIPKGMTLTNTTNDLVATVSEPRIQEEPEEEVPVEGEETSEGEEKKEGDLPAEDEKKEEKVKEKK